MLLQEFPTQFIVQLYKKKSTTLLTIEYISYLQLQNEYHFMLEI